MREIKSASTTPVLLRVGFVLLFLFVFLLGFFLLQIPMPKPLLTILAILWGVGGIVLLFHALNSFVYIFPKVIQKRIEFLIFIGPAALILLWYLILPTLRTFFASFFDKTGGTFIGLENYAYVFTNESMQVALVNNVIWLLFGTGFCVIFGLVAAILSDRVKFERLSRAIIFMPLAISFVGAGIIWRFVYSYRPTGFSQIGFLNAVVGLFGVEPINWLLLRPWNTLLLIVIFVWLQTGFAMVIFSAAIKGVPIEIIEAARVDGVNEFKIIMHIVLPSIKGTIVTVSTTILILTLKIFDIVYSITNGLYGTEVLASQQYKSMFKFLHYGQGSAIAIVLLLAVIPVMIYNLRRIQSRGV